MRKQREFYHKLGMEVPGDIKGETCSAKQHLDPHRNGETKADDSSNKEAAEEKQEDDNDYHRSDEQVSGCGVCPNTATGRTCTGRLRWGCALAQQRGRREGNGARTLARPACACLHFFNCRSNVCSLQNILNIQKLRFTLRTLGAPSVPRSSLSNSVPSDFGVHANVT